MKPLFHLWGRRTAERLGVEVSGRFARSGGRPQSGAAGLPPELLSLGMRRSRAGIAVCSGETGAPQGRALLAGHRTRGVDPWPSSY
jgi:hypothetical protein